MKRVFDSLEQAVRALEFHPHLKIFVIKSDGLCEFMGTTEFSFTPKYVLAVNDARAALEFLGDGSVIRYSAEETT